MQLGLIGGVHVAGSETEEHCVQRKRGRKRRVFSNFNSTSTMQQCLLSADALGGDSTSLASVCCGESARPSASVPEKYRGLKTTNKKCQATHLIVCLLGIL